MLNRLSVNALLKTVIAILGSATVIMLALNASSSWQRLGSTNRIAAVANASTFMFIALNSLRVDRSASFRDLVAERTLTAMSPLVKDARDAEMPALNSMLGALAAVDLPERDQVIADFSNRIRRLTDLQQQSAAAFLQAKSARPAPLAQAYYDEADGLMTALDKWGTRLVAFISLQNAYVDQLMEIKQLAWQMRNAGGDASLVVSNTLGGQPIPAGAMDAYMANVGKLDAAWASASDIASRVPTSPGLTAAIDKVRKDYFGSEYSTLRTKVLKALLAGQSPGITVDEW